MLYVYFHMHCDYALVTNRKPVSLCECCRRGRRCSQALTQCLTVPICSCQCPFGWKGALCSETVSVCDVEHSPPPLCAHGSTCIPLPSGYTCQCPLGTAGVYCEKGCLTEAVTLTCICYIFIKFIFLNKAFAIKFFNC